MIKGIIFDLDGVLVFTDKYHYLAWKQIADKEGIPFDETINHRLRGVSRMDSLEIILEKASREYTQEEKIALATAKNDIYRSYLEKMTPSDVDPKSRATLEELKSQGYLLAIGSSSRNTALILEKTNLGYLFDAVSDGNGLVNSKPDPEVFLKAAKMLGLSPKECLVVEDADAGIEAARRGEFISVGINIASKNRNTKYPIQELSDLLRVLERTKGLVFEHVNKIYRNGVHAVKDFCLEIEDQEFVVFVGPSGCGKSTVLRMIAGLEEISGGNIFISGHRINDVEAKDRNIAMVFQNYALYPSMTVEQNIGFSLKIKKVKKSIIKEKVLEAARILGLEDYLSSYPSQLSGGQKQRVALGRAMVREPDVFLLDEPLSNLDAKMRTTMRTEISKLHRRLKTTFIYVTHDQVEAMTMGTKIVVLKDGIIQQVGSPIEIYNHPINTFVAGFIGTPQMNMFDGTILLKGNDYVLNILNQEIKLPLDVTMSLPIEDIVSKELIVGIRPSDIKVVDSMNSSSIKGNFFFKEQLGSEYLLEIKVNSLEEELKVVEQYAKEYLDNQEMYLELDLSRLHFFFKDNLKKC